MSDTVHVHVYEVTLGDEVTAIVAPSMRSALETFLSDSDKEPNEIKCAWQSVLVAKP